MAVINTSDKQPEDGARESSATMTAPTDILRTMTTAGNNKAVTSNTTTAAATTTATTTTAVNSTTRTEETSKSGGTIHSEITGHECYKKHKSTRNNSSQCPSIPPKLVGRLKIDQGSPSWTELEADPGFARLTSGGEFSPDCKSEHSGNMITHPDLLLLRMPSLSVAIILPYRNRDEQLRTFLHHIHPVLMRQNIHYRWVITQC